MADPRMLPPSMRPPKRYIVYQVISESPIVYGEFVNAVWTTAMEFLGELGASDANVWFVHNTYNPEKQAGIIKCRHDHVEKLRAVMSLISVVSESKCMIRILGVTGTIKSAKTKYFS
ncbi:MAG: ribonuclease P protein component 2 [Candidatus Aenigmarchaeota archaeon]|nr:ribonuclease P protein component 2 [Candidatus Aenigmarchaeota archaeon]